jgi:hypothetical protein
MYEDTVLAILPDDSGHLWLSGNHGIARVSRAELEEVSAGRKAQIAPTVFGVADGMRERECNGGSEPSAWRSSDGRLWFATIGGVVVIDPSRVEARPKPPTVKIEELLVDGRTRFPSDSLRLEPGTRHVDVRYTGLTLAAGDRIRFRHRLVGLDNAFIDAAGERVAHYTNLDPGRYVLEVAAAYGSGGFGQTTSVSFWIEPHFWQTGFFSLAVGVGILALVLGAPLARIRGLKKRETVLTARVEEELRKVKILTGLLPTCAWCKKIRNESGDWQRFEDYVSTHADVQFTHGMCPDCYVRLSGGEKE